MANASLGWIVAFLSGALSYASTYVPDSWGVRWGAGLVFGVLVLAPGHRDRVRAASLVALSAVVYRGAVWLAQTLYGGTVASGIAVCALSGVLGAVALSLGSSALLRRPVAGRAILLASLTGALGGVSIGLCVNGSDESISQQVLLLAGYVIWQVGYAAAHRLPEPLARS